MERTYRTLYLTLLGATSLATLVALAYIWAEETGTQEWVTHQKRYARLLLERAKTETQRAAAQGFRVSVRQVVIPALDRVDRCVSCHLGVDNPAMVDAPQPYRTHPGTVLEDHPVEKYGCTVCHRGQGHVLAQAEAHAVEEGVHWDWPLLPPDLVVSACAVCHSASWLGARGQEPIARGSTLFNTRGCFGCHKLRGKGGTMSVALDDEGNKIFELFVNRQNLMGEKTVAQWQFEHLLDPQRIVPESRMINPFLTRDEATDLVTFLFSLVDVSLPREYIPDDYYEKYGFERLDGKGLYERYCYACHADGTYTRYVKEFGRFVPAVRNPDFLDAASDEFLLATLREGREGTEMPAWKKSVGGLRDEELERLAGYLRERRTSPPPAQTAVDVSLGDYERGRGLFQKLCAGCHGAEGKGGVAPKLASITFASLDTEAMLAETIAEGRRNTPMPRFVDGNRGLDAKEVADLVVYVKYLTRGPAEAQRARRPLERTNY